MDDLSCLGPEFHQDVILDGNGHAHTIHTFDVHVYASAASAIGAEDAGSNKVKITTLTNQNWELPKHQGKMVTSNIHYLGYALDGRMGYVLRLIRRDNSFRTLLKGFVGRIMDVSFCHSHSNLLACLDEGGNLYIWDLDMAKSEATAQKDAMKVTVQQGSVVLPGEHRLMWSPHVMSDEEEDDEQDICNIVITHGNYAEVLDVHNIFSKYSSGSIVPRDKLSCNLQAIPGAHDDDILDVSLSPDGSVLATASKDGKLKFWQVNLEAGDEESSKCLHDFKPHKGAAVTRLLFCDNHLCQDPSNQFWRFLVTASQETGEMKIWCTVNWKCLQTIRFLPPQEEDFRTVQPHILLSMDLSASYIIVADSRRKVFLILQLATNMALGDASVTSVTEYLLTQPMLSFVVCGCAPLTERMDVLSEGDSADEEEEESANTKTTGLFDTRRNVAMIKLHCVHTRFMQELLVKFEPPDLFGVPPSREHPKLILPTSSHGNDLSLPSLDTSLPPVNQPLPSLAGGTESATPTKSALTHSPRLLTPSDITSNKHDTTPLLSPADILASTSSTIAGSTGATAAAAADDDDDDAAADDDDDGIDEASQTTQGRATLLDTTSDSLADLLTDSKDIEHVSLANISEPAKEQGGGEDIGAVTPPSISDSEDEVKSKPVSSTGGIDGSEAKESEPPEGLTSGEPLLQQPVCGNDEEEPSEEERKKSFENIMKLLHSDKMPEMVSLQTQTLEEFQEIIADPEKMQEEIRRVEKIEQELPELEDEATTSAGRSLLDHSNVVDNLEGDIENSAAVAEKGEDMAEAAGVTEDQDLGGDHSVADEEVKTGVVASDDQSKSCSSVDLDKTLLSGSEPRMDANAEKRHSAGEVPRPETPLGTPPQLDQSEKQDSSERQEAAVAAAMPEARGVQGEESSETCGAMKSSEVKLTMPFALSDDNLLGNQSLMSVDQPTPTKHPKATTDLEESTTEVPPCGATATEALPTICAPPTDPLIVETPPSRNPPTDTTPSGAISTTQSHDNLKAGQKTKRARKRAKKNRKEVNAVDIVEVDDRTSDVEVSNGDSQLVLVEPPHQPCPLPEATPTRVSPTSLHQQEGVLTQLAEIMAAHRDLLEKMESEQHTTRVAMQLEIQHLRDSFLEEQKTAMAEFRREQQTKLDRMMKEKQSLDKTKQDKLISSLSQTLTAAVHAKLDKVVRTEMKNAVVPAITESVSAVRGELSLNVSQCMAQTNDVIKSKLVELLKSKDMLDVIGRTVSTQLQAVLPLLLETIFKTVVLEPVERAFQGMFKQIDETFRKGTMEYLMQLQQQQQLLQGNLVQHIDSSLQVFHSSLASPQTSAPWTAHLQDAMRQEMSVLSHRLQEGVVEVVSGVLHKEVTAMVDLQAKAPPHKTEKDRKSQISQLLKNQRYNEAFELCLSTADLALVIYTCQQVDPDILFDSSPIPLSQAVLLSLIQQLSVDLLDNLDMKIKFLDPSVLALDEQDEVTKSHMPPVIKQLSEQLRIVQDKANSSSISPALLKQVKRLFQVTLHMCH